MSDTVLIAGVGLLSAVLVKAIDRAVDLILAKRKRQEAVEDRTVAAAQTDAERLDRIERKLDCHIEMEERRRADEDRLAVLTFTSAEKRGIQHTKEEWDELLRKVDTYEAYCDGHPDYPNTVATLSISYLRATYGMRLEGGTFL